jgi:hypothetical protein
MNSSILQKENLAELHDFMGMYIKWEYRGECMNFWYAISQAERIDSRGRFTVPTADLSAQHPSSRSFAYT